LLWLWRFAARQTKAQILDVNSGRGNAGSVDQDYNTSSTPTNGEQGRTSGGWVAHFVDPSLPLVVDIGCGMGVSLLGLSTLRDKYRRKQDPVVPSVLGRVISDFPTFGESCNYIGGDLSRLFIGYARGISKRWDIDGRLQFAETSAVDLLKDVVGLYPPGKVALIMIQFPTPFKLGAKIEGNQQLPIDEASAFMVATRLLRIAFEILRESNGFLLLHSNCEDVVVKMRRMAVEQVGFECVDLGPGYFVTELPGLDSPENTLSSRSRQWIRMEGDRPVGNGWLLGSCLPTKGCSETEVNCMIQGTRVHRCLLRVRRSQ
jgi:SAM-dependent methyltransferase